jgi:CBS domain containing-hemolysin-like protein
VVAELLEDRARIQPALGVFHTGLLVVAAIPATWALTRRLEGGSLLASLLVLGVLLVLIGDLIPRGIGRGRPRRLAYRMAWLLRPVVELGDAAADFIHDVDDTDDVDDEDDDEESAAARELISSVLEFGDTIVREVMVPRPDMVTLPASASTDEALDLVLESRRSRIPVVGDGGADDVVGVLYARDLLKLHDEGAPPTTCRELARAAYFVPETMSASDLLREMQANQVHLAVVVDEYGGTAGLVTIEDLLEELVGEIADEYDEEPAMVTLLANGEYLVDARMGIDDFEELIGFELPDEEADTVGGLVLALAGRVPVEGERFDLNDHVLIADRVQGRRISRVRLAGR